LSLYIDASALVTLLMDEPDTRWAQDIILPAVNERIVSDFCVAEVASAMSKYVRTRQLEAEAAHDLLVRFDAWITADTLFVESGPADIAEAGRLVRRFELKLRTPDALHLALAKRFNAKVLTRDRGMARAAEMIGLAVATPA
jgi:uncharacterized protein